MQAFTLPNICEALHSPSASAPEAKATWVDLCALSDILPNTGVAALVSGEQVALVRVGADTVYAISNFDPFSKAFVLSRGLVGDRDGVVKIASPIYKQSFDLATGQCLDDSSVQLRTYATRIREGRVELLVKDD